MWARNGVQKGQSELGEPPVVVGSHLYKTSRRLPPTIYLHKTQNPKEREEESVYHMVSSVLTEGMTRGLGEDGGGMTGRKGTGWGSARGLNTSSPGGKNLGARVWMAGAVSHPDWGESPGTHGWSCRPISPRVAGGGVLDLK
ncbi:hypothetical protein J6590_033924 [Homalodisca vitripennis]|nr:hypothetical protein J6590_033924 [Homalodisca vitripennis]